MIYRFCIAICLTGVLMPGIAKAAGPRPRITAFVGDSVIPQFVNGAGWKTTIFIVNLGTIQESYEIDFWTSAGGPLQVPVLGQTGSVSTITGALTPGQSVVYETDDTAPTFAQGWATVLPGTATVARLAGFAVFRQRVAGRQDSEAVVPFCNLFDNSFVLLYDNTEGFSTGVALANVNPQSAVSVTATLRDQSGATVSTGVLQFPPLSQSVFTLATQYPATANKRGSILFTSSGITLSGLGLRFSPGGSFTSFNVLNTVDMLH